MSALILDIANKLRAIPGLMPQLITEVIMENESLIVDMNIKQLDEGMRADGTILPDYSPVSVEKYGKRPGPITLEDTGSFKRQIFIKAFDDAFALDSADSKTPMLKFEFGIDILGVIDQNKEIIATDILIPGLEEKVKTYLQLQ